MAETSGGPIPAVPPPEHAASSTGRGGSTATLPGGSARPETTASSGAPAPGSHRRGGLPLVWFRRHAVFLVVLLVGLAGRVLVQLAFKPALVVGESGSYLHSAKTWTPSVAHPLGYGVLELTPLSWLAHALGSVVAVQHLLGLATGVAVYCLLLRWGVWRWLAALAAVPVLWDAYVLASEHMVLPDTLFVFVVCLALLVLSWGKRPSLRVALLGGVLLGAAATVRTVGELLILVAVAFMLLTATSWRSRFAGALVVTVGFALPVVPYVAWYHHVYGEYALAQAQTAEGSGAPVPWTQPRQPDLPHGADVVFDWSRADRRTFPDVGKWLFTNHASPGPSSPLGVVGAGRGGEQVEAFEPAADALVAYQSHGYLPGPFLLGGLLLAFAASVGFGRAATSGMRAVCLLTAVVPAVVLLGAVAAGDFSWRNLLPGLVLWPAAGALGLTALLRGRRSPVAGRPQVDDADRAALAAFRDRYGDPALAPVVVVIAAYNEAVGLPHVLSRMPSTVCGLPIDVVVVDDGSTDGTAVAADEHGGAYLVSSPVNRGQGAAMRLGYRVARSHGAAYIITTDADAQYDTADFPTVLAPLLEGSADFVTGSRRLGRQHTIDRFRRAGVHVFAWAVSGLIGQRLTDTSFGLRAMRAEVTAAVTLNQPQYQSAELLIGAHSHGYRIAEVPGTMNLRAAGTTKKGGNVVYGFRYARVVLGTWWREGCPAPVTEHAPAMLEHRDPAHAPVAPGW